MKCWKKCPQIGDCIYIHDDKSDLAKVFKLEAEGDDVLITARAVEFDADLQAYASEYRTEWDEV